jgi:hypothetical protein
MPIWPQVCQLVGIVLRAVKGNENSPASRAFDEAWKRLAGGPSRGASRGQLGYGIGSGAVESAHKQVIHARLRQAGMHWSEAGARRLLALRLLLLNHNWALLDRMRMPSLA